MNRIQPGRFQSLSEDFERVLLGACLRFPENVQIVIDRLEAEDFSSPRNRDIFSTIKSLYEKKAPVELVSVSNELKVQAKEIPAYKVAELVDEFIDGFDLDYYVTQLKTFSKRRRLDVALENALNKIRDSSLEYPEIEECIVQDILAVMNEKPVVGIDQLSLPTLDEISDLNIEVEWVVDKLIPKGGITALHGRGGLGKTWLVLQMGSCIADGRPFCGLSTLKENVYFLDFENPLPEMVHRGRVLGGSSLRLWHLSHTPPPPRLDVKEWVLYKSLPPGVVVFDSMRSAHHLDENSSKDMTIIMSRLKELREIGHTIIALLHAPKANEHTYKGSTALIDQADHALGFERVRQVGADTAVDADDENDLPFRLGHIQKTRFTPYKMYLRFDPNRGFRLAPDPEQQTFKAMHQTLLNHYRNFGSPNQMKFVDIVKAELNLSKEKIINLIKKGDGTLWNSLIERKFNNRITYTPVFYEGNEHY